MIALAFLLLACDGGSSGDDTGTVPALSCSATANLELVPLDVWGRDLTGTSRTLDHDPTPVADPAAGPGVVLYRLGEEPAALAVAWEAADHARLSLRVDWTGHGGKDGFTVVGPVDPGQVAWSWGIRRLGDDTCPVFTVYAGLDHAWFAPSGPPPTRNALTFLADGQDFWASVAADLETTSRRVTWSTWWWESDFEFERPADHVTVGEAERWQRTSLGHLEALASTERRLLVNRFWGENSDYTTWLNTDAALLALAEAPGDGFEVVLQANETEVPVFEPYTGTAPPIDFAARVLSNPRYAERDVVGPTIQVPVDLTLEAASWHQKAMVFDGRVAFVAGMNTKGADWDSSDHRVYDPRRMAFDATTDERYAVEDREALPDYGPRKDYGVRVEGPAVRDVEAVLQQRWDQALAEGSEYAENATPFDLDPAAAEPAGGVPLQVVATMPEPAPLQAIAETHARALANASSYVYIEDQYFRAPMMNDVLVARMLQEPDLVLVVVTMDVSPWDGGAQHTYLSDATFRALFPDRYLLLQLRSVDLVTDPDAWWDEAEFIAQDMDTHSKLRLVDDRYLSVGSCNYNNRGYLYEGELDVAVLDEDTTASVRRRVFENLVGEDWAPYLSDDARNNFDVLRQAAESNAGLTTWWADNAADLDADEAEALWATDRPSGFVYPLEISGDYEWDVGSDAF